MSIDIDQVIERASADTEALFADDVQAWAWSLEPAQSAVARDRLLAVGSPKVIAQWWDHVESTRPKREAPRRTAAEAATAEGVAPPPEWAMTDLGNAERFVVLFGDRVRYCPPRRRWLVWDGRRWNWDERKEIEQFAKETARSIYEEAAIADDHDRRKALAKHATMTESSGRLRSMIDCAACEKGVVVLPADLDADPWLLTVKNGTLDLRTGVLRAHHPNDLITKLVPVAFDPSAICPTWDSFLDDITAGDVEFAEYLQRVAGYCLTGVQSEKCFFFPHGPKDTGKSTLLEALQMTFGDYAGSASADTWLEQSWTGGNRGDLVRLMGKRLVASAEMKKGARWDEALIKRITGGDAIIASAKYESEIEFRASFKILVAGNDAPKLRDDDEALWSRMRRLPFENKPKKIDKTIREKLTNVDHAGAAILAWAVRGCAAWQRDGLGTCAAVEASTAAYRDEMDRFEPFARDYLRFEPFNDIVITAADLRVAYETWCKENGVRAPLSSDDLATRLRERGALPAKSNGRRIWRRVRRATDAEVTDGAAPRGVEGRQGAPIRETLS